MCECSSDSYPYGYNWKHIQLFLPFSYERKCVVRTYVLFLLGFLDDGDNVVVKLTALGCHGVEFCVTCRCPVRQIKKGSKHINSELPQHYRLLNDSQWNFGSPNSYCDGYEAFETTQRNYENCFLLIWSYGKTFLRLMIDTKIYD
jgi:hypothetical protein